MTNLHPRSLSIAAEISPVWGPDACSETFWAPRDIPLPDNKVAVSARYTKGGQIATSAEMPSLSPAATPLISGCTVCRVPFIFQLAATSACRFVMRFPCHAYPKGRKAYNKYRKSENDSTYASTRQCRQSRGSLQPSLACRTIRAWYSLYRAGSGGNAVSNIRCKLV